MWERELIDTVELLEAEPGYELFEETTVVSDEWADLVATVEEALEQWWQTSAPALVRAAGERARR